MLAASYSHADAQAVSPKRELRGVWISTHLSLDWPNRLQTPEQQRAALAGILDHNKATGMNAAFLQVRSQADAMYPSDLEPWSYYLTNQQGSAPAPSWDPLHYAIAETRKRGMSSMPGSTPTARWRIRPPNRTTRSTRPITSRAPTPSGCCRWAR